MQLYPAIDIKDGQCVRLTQGEFKNVKVYSNRPWEMAAYWEAQGGTYLHLVDLDGALSGRLVNEEVIKNIVKSVRIPVQIGGGIRNIQTIEALLNMGISRVIIGTKAVQNPDFMKEMIDTFGAEKIVAGVDAKSGMVAVEGWEKISNSTALELCLLMKSYGVKQIVYTDIAKDGMLQGPNVSDTKLLTEKTGLNIIASGGVSKIDDLQTLYDAKIKGAIIGKALYEKRIDLREATNRFE